MNKDSGLSTKVSVTTPGALRTSLKLNMRVLEPYLYLMPALLIFGVFMFAPLIFAFYLALTDWDLISSNYDIVWFENFIRLATDHRFVRAVKNTVYFSMVTVPVQMVLALTLALLLNERIRLRSFFRAIYFAPVLVPVTVTAIIWMFIFSPSFGIMNYLLEQFGLPGPAWFSDPKWAMPAIMILAVWQNFGYHTIIFLAGLQSIPQTLVEAAYVDGASKWQAFWRITFSLLAPTTFFVVIVYFIGALQMFVQVWVMTGAGTDSLHTGGPIDSTLTVVVLLYHTAFEYLKMGYGAAISVVLFMIIAVITVVNARLLNYDVGY